MNEHGDILIAGAGIAGLTVALALSRKGLSSTVIEAFEKPSEIGAGIQLAPNATRVLDRLGVLAQVRQKAVAPASIRLGDAESGQIVLDMAISPAWLERMGAPYLTVHRAALHGALYDAASADPAITLLTGHKLAGAEETPDLVTVQADTADGMRDLRSRVLIGADGIWSRLRASVPGAAKPVATGRIAWRAVGPGATLGDNRSVTAWMAPRSHIISYPIRNSETLNIVAITQGNGGEKKWDRPAEAAEMRGLVEAGGHGLGQAFLKNVSWTVWPLYTVDPSAQWHTSRICLVGDAAHGMEPFSAQGAAMAIEDGYCMAACLARHPADPGTAFRQYRSSRCRRIGRVARRTAFNRWVYHQTGPGRWVRNRLFSVRSGSAFLADLEWLYGYRMPD